MKPFVWNETMSAEESKDGAYWERNMLALLFANIVNRTTSITFQGQSGWYYHGEWEGWTRVISLLDGKVTFHVPDDFDMGNLPEIEPNWDEHTTKEKWERVMKICGIETSEG